MFRRYSIASLNKQIDWMIGAEWMFGHDVFERFLARFQIVVATWNTLLLIWPRYRQANDSIRCCFSLYFLFLVHIQAGCKRAHSTAE